MLRESNLDTKPCQLKELLGTRTVIRPNKSLSILAIVFPGDLWFSWYPRHPWCSRKSRNGRDGVPGSRGTAGEKGEPGVRGNDYVDLVKSNWKQCVWKKNDDKDSGLIQV